jgi:protease I
VKTLAILVSILSITANISAQPMTPSRVQTQQLGQLSATSAVPTINTAALFAAEGAENDRLRELVFDEPSNRSALQGRRVAILTTDGVEELELTITLDYLKRRGAEVHIVAPPASEIPKLGLTLPPQRSTHILTVRYMENGGWVKFDRSLANTDLSSYDALIIPGGAWNPDNLRMDPNVLKAVKQAMAKGIIVASICHGPQVLISAGQTKGRKLTGYWAIQTDLKNSGATVTDVPVVVDGNLITSRYPLDLPEFLEGIGKALEN